MRTLATKVDNSIHEQVVNRCTGLNCNPSEYIRNLINKDLDTHDSNNNTLSTSVTTTFAKNLPSTTTATATIIATQKPSKIIIPGAKQKVADSKEAASMLPPHIAVFRPMSLLHNGKKYSYCSRCKIWYTQ